MQKKKRTRAEREGESTAAASIKCLSVSFLLFSSLRSAGFTPASSRQRRERRERATRAARREAESGSRSSSSESDWLQNKRKKMFAVPHSKTSRANSRSLSSFLVLLFRSLARERQRESEFFSPHRLLSLALAAPLTGHQALLPDLAASTAAAAVKQRSPFLSGEGKQVDSFAIAFVFFLFSSSRCLPRPRAPSATMRRC